MMGTPWQIEHFNLIDRATGVEHLISVDLPARYDQLDAPPLVVVLDGPWLFGTVADAVRIMSTSRESPEAIVVGVSFTDTKVSDYFRQRARWYTPSRWKPPEEAGVKGVEADECGRAAEFRSFLIDGLLVELARRYRFGQRWLVGHSFSALFTLDTLFADPDAFDHWMMLSPSVWWDDRHVLSAEAAYADANTDLAATAFISAGSAEDDNAVAHLFRIRANAAELVERIESRNYPSLTLHYAVLDGGTHSSCLGHGVAKGLRAFHRGEI